MIFAFVLTVTGVFGLTFVGAVLSLVSNARRDTPTPGGLAITAMLLGLTSWGCLTLGALS